MNTAYIIAIRLLWNHSPSEWFFAMQKASATDVHCQLRRPVIL